MIILENSRILRLKFALFVVLGSLACGIALLLFPSWRLAILMALAIWAFCRAYYFAFYVIENYIDTNYRYAGLWDLARYIFRNADNSDAEPN